ncbi:MAG: hypothetical protein ACOYJD_08125 [Christensenellales bacterium]|jgi:hypothetical protein
MKFERFTIRDISFLAIMAALLFICSAVAMPLMSITLFGLRNMAMAIFYGLFATMALMRVRKIGAMSLLGFFNAAILLMMSPVMFVTMTVSAIFAEIIALVLFRSYQTEKAILTAACLMVPLSLPFTAVFSMIMNDVAFSDVVQGSWLVLFICLGTVLLSFTGGFIGRKIGKELRKAGKL